MHDDDDARRRKEFISRRRQGHTFRKAEPAYYLLVPLAVPADIATLPCQYLLAYLIKASCSCM